jgi:hypothetical protein
VLVGYRPPGVFPLNCLVLGMAGAGQVYRSARGQHPGDEPNGEVASLDLALVTGRGPGMLTDLDGLRPLVRDEDVALVGYRAFGDNMPLPAPSEKH